LSIFFIVVLVRKKVKNKVVARSVSPPAAAKEEVMQGTPSLSWQWVEPSALPLQLDLATTLKSKIKARHGLTLVVR
jgi:hypothetical protein